MYSRDEKGKHRTNVHAKEHENTKKKKKKKKKDNNVVQVYTNNFFHSTVMAVTNCNVMK